MAERLNSKIYVNGGYLDDNISVANIPELLAKESSNSFFLGQSIHMSEAFLSANEIPYPVDFWSVPSGENIKWEIKSIPTIESDEDFSKFKEFINDFNEIAGYYPLSNGFEILVNGINYSYSLNENSEIVWNEKINDIEKIIDGASESFDTLKEIEDWINQHGNNVIQGPQGAQGFQGEKGADGERGFQGNQGPQGAMGKDGTSVTILGTFNSESELPLEDNKNGDGYIINGDLFVWGGSEWNNVGKIQGPQGEKGADGERGFQGFQGNQGSQGADGERGYQGFQGYQGPQGADGERGYQGFQGEKGADGERGFQGFQGYQGPQGADGERGFQGFQGEKGADGERGFQGFQGEKGADGERGFQGFQGERGFQGPQGAMGKDGTSVTILGTFNSESELPLEDNKNGDGYIINGDLFVWSGSEWNNVGKIQGPQGEKGADGERGYQGPQGAKGVAGPQGEKGADGVAGERGYQGYQGAKGDSSIYENGTGISIIDNKVNVLIETGDTENRNYLIVNENNELSVESIGLDDAVTTEEIVVNGGSWADEVNAVYGDKIPVGTSWQDFLKNMLCVEKFADAITTSTAFTVSCGNLTPGIDKSGTVEVGTKVTLGEINANQTTAKQSLTAKTFTYGYKLGESGSHNSSTTYTETLTPIKVESNDALKVVFSKFVNNISGGTELEVINANGSVDSIEMYVMEGSNSISVFQTGDTYTSSSAVTAGTIYVATNLKNYYKSDKVTPNTYIPTFAEKTLTASAKTTYSVTGAHKYYIGDIYDYSDDYWNANRSEVIREFALKDWATGNTITVPYTFKEMAKQQTVVVPSVYNEVSGKDINNGPVTFNFIKEINFHNSQGYVSSFKVFVAPAIDGLGADSYITITISK